VKRYLLYLVLTGQFIGAGLAQQRATAPPKTHTIAAPMPSAKSVWADLIEGNGRFITGKTTAVNMVTLRQALAKGQAPKVVVLACSDSRVAPEILFDQSLGDLFVVRAAGNIADAIGVGSIEYAVEHLGSSVLVVLGHEKCGAVTAACSGDKMPTANLQAMVDKIAPAVTQAKNHANSDQLVEAAILENVHQSARDVLASSEVLQHFLHDGRLTVFEAVYKLDSGEVKLLRTISDHDDHDDPFSDIETAKTPRSRN
jgi:carbonic anhydrase